MINMYVDPMSYNIRNKKDYCWAINYTFGNSVSEDEIKEILKKVINVFSRDKDFCYTCVKCEDITSNKIVQNQIYGNIAWKFAYKSESDRDYVQKLIDEEICPDHVDYVYNNEYSIKCPFINEV